jgi:hypothetical protein
MNTTTATKKIALATLAAPVLAALAIGMAGTAAADWTLVQGAEGPSNQQASPLPIYKVEALPRAPSAVPVRVG